MVLNYHNVPVKDPDNLLMASVVDLVRLIAQLMNLGVKESALRQHWIPLTIVCLKLDPFKLKLLSVKEKKKQ